MASSIVELLDANASWLILPSERGKLVYDPQLGKSAHPAARAALCGLFRLASNLYEGSSAELLRKYEEIEKPAIADQGEAAWCLSVEQSEAMSCIAVDAAFLQRLGRRSKWKCAAGVLFAFRVDAHLRARGLKPSSRKALRNAINDIRKANPRRYGRYSEERLRTAYYDGLAHCRTMLARCRPHQQVPCAPQKSLDQLYADLRDALLRDLIFRKPEDAIRRLELSRSARVVVPGRTAPSLTPKTSPVRKVGE